MPKFSQIPVNSSPVIGDYVIGVTVGNVDQRITIAQLAALVSANITDGSIKQSDLDFTNFDVFSTSETDTGRKWVDGRTIYRKVLRGSMSVVVNANNIAHGITGISTLEVISCEGNIVLGSGVRGSSVNLFWHRETGGNWMNPTAINSTTFTFTSSFAWGTTMYTVILEYVK